MGNNVNEQNDFYIGWQPKAPEAFSNKVKRFILILAVLVPIISAILVMSQRGFVDAVFEFGKLTEVEGILVKIPVPMIKIKNGLDKNGNPNFQSILLVGFGKTGADSTLTAIEKEQGKSLENEVVTLKGTLIYYDGKKVLELTEGKESFVSFGKFETFSGGRELLYSVTKDFSDVSLKGEIYDPKCAFGVMKPGNGKPHRSCAVRCVSGGIPPILRIKNKAGEANYCILVGPEGQAINQDVLDFLADQVLVCGHLEQKDDWLVLYTDPSKDILRLQPYWMKGEVPLCSNL
jgi:hypothetical protein